MLVVVSAGPAGSLKTALVGAEREKEVAVAKCEEEIERLKRRAETMTAEFGEMLSGACFPPWCAVASALGRCNRSARHVLMRARD